jgi:8-oxo-dGTP pyrophosphatase MutT (NUDIX family)
MRSSPAKWIGTLAFYVTIPALYFYLQRDERTRVVVIHGNDVLVLKGWYGSNKWMLPGGGIHKGEEPLIAALRELKEETSVVLEPDQLKYHGKDVINENYGLKYTYHMYSVRLGEKPVVKHQRLEICDSKWVPVQQVINDKKGTLRSTRQIVQVWSNT